MKQYDVVIIGSGPAGLGAAFELCEDRTVAVIERHRYSSGGLRNDCKQNYTYPVGFPVELWSPEDAEPYLERVRARLNPRFREKRNISVYRDRARKIGVELLDTDHHHVGTDKAKDLIDGLVSSLKERGVDFLFETEVIDVDHASREVICGAQAGGQRIGYETVIIAPGRSGFRFVQELMDKLDITYTDNTVDIGIRLETRIEYYPIVRDYYDPKFIFPNGVRTFCANSGYAQVVQEKYDHFTSVNGHAYSRERGENGLVNFAMLRTITLTEPVASGQKFATILGQAAMEIGGGRPIKQRVGDFRLGKRSKRQTFDSDLYDFESTLDCTHGDISLAIPAKILTDIWKAMKMLDTIVPGVLHPSTVMYYPEIKCYANRPRFTGPGFQVTNGVYMIGDGAGTSRGITAAWASGIRCADAIRAR
ncbi:MAG: FAD-dependent oxidoreductase [Acidobacteriota bacterium]